ncbi:MAG: Tol-Pal system beta propeller repeat protein TolB [Nitrospirae bacterium]|nr:Tol-Pal system beta propeller repeat protein TolB [Nitrospirota bacterium]
MKKLLLTTIILLCVLVNTSRALVYIDINSPSLRAVPTAIYDFRGDPSGRELADIIRADLQASGVFEIVSKQTYIESDLPAFNPSNWIPLGIDLVIKGAVLKENDTIVVTAYLYDVVGATVILKKQYRANSKFIRPLAHSISNDIYKSITGEDGPFRTKIAFVGKKRGKRKIYLMDWDGKRVQDTGITGELLTSVHWSNDANRLVYSAIRGKQWGIYIADFKTGREKLVLRSRGTNIAGEFIPGRNAFLFSSSLKGSPDIFVYNIKDNTKSRITWNRSIEVSPTVSPDGKWMAFVSDRAGTPQIYVMRLDGTRLKRISFVGGYNTSPDWSPKGDLIAFSGLIGGKHQIFVVKPDGTDLRQLTQNGNNEDPSFSPDGRFIAFVSDRRGYKAIYVVRIDGRIIGQLTHRGIEALSPEWSPNKIF